MRRALFQTGFGLAAAAGSFFTLATLGSVAFAAVSLTGLLVAARLSGPTEAKPVRIRSDR